jgi:hypothetical protein
MKHTCCEIKTQKWIQSSVKMEINLQSSGKYYSKSLRNQCTGKCGLNAKFCKENDVQSIVEMKLIICMFHTG